MKSKPKGKKTMTYEVFGSLYLSMFQEVQCDLYIL